MVCSGLYMTVQNIIENVPENHLPVSQQGF
jgi:hypothetical protein